MDKKTEAKMIEAIREFPDSEFMKIMDRMDEHIARTDPWAFREFTGKWPTKADKGLVDHLH